MWRKTDNNDPSERNDLLTGQPVNKSLLLPVFLYIVGLLSFIYSS